MWILLLACTAGTDDSSTSLGGPLEEGLPTTSATMGPSCDEVDGGAWELVVGEADTTCPGAVWTDLTDVVRLNVAGSQEGPAATGETIDLMDTGTYSAVTWRRAGAAGTLTAGSVQFDPWDPATAQLTGALDLSGSFPDGDIHTTGAFTASYCPDPELVCG